MTAQIIKEETSIIGGQDTKPEEPVTRDDILHLERVIRDLSDKKYVCPFNDRLVLLLEHDLQKTAQLEEHEKDINGNGEIGMKESIRILMKEREDRIKLQWIIITAFVGQFLILYFKQ